jgi:lipopolysaccharide/colanic/teichoic acid biosynthesis glycosyltransferase
LKFVLFLDERNCLTVVKAQRMLLVIFASRRFILIAPVTLILSVICCAASDKSLAFQFTIKTQQFQGQNDICEVRSMVYE